MKSVTRKVMRCLAIGTAGWHLLNGDVGRVKLKAEVVRRETYPFDDGVG